MPKKSNPLVTHQRIIEVTRPAYMLGIIGGAITLAISLFLLLELIQTNNFLSFGWVSFLGIAVLVHIAVSILMLVGSYLLRVEHHSLGGSIMLLCASILGLNFASGLVVGPILGIIGGVLGMAEHEKLIKHY